MDQGQKDKISYQKSFQFESRNPGPEDIEDMTTLLPDLRDRILAASTVKKLRRIL